MTNSVQQALDELRTELRDEARVLFSARSLGCKVDSDLQVL